jgi:hypothetical protein
MHPFALALFLAFAAMALAGWVCRTFPVLRHHLFLVVLGFGVGAAWLADLNLWNLWGIAVRREWIGVTLTGLAIGGMGAVAHAVLEPLAAVGRKTMDEAEVLERSEHLRAA